MAATEHGTELRGNLVEIPGATFVITKSGFDTGTRTFKCDSAYVAQLAPARGSADATYPQMFVEDITITNGKAGIAMVAVTYKGVIISDPTGGNSDNEDAIQYYVNAQVDAIVILASPNDTAFTKYEPLVTHTYTTTTFPDFSVGEYHDPPKFADKIPAQTIVIPYGSASAGTWYLSYSEAGWRLDNRQVRSVGEAYEVSDSYLYKYKVNSVVDPNGTTYNLSPPQ